MAINIEILIKNKVDKENLKREIFKALKEIHQISGAVISFGFFGIREARDFTSERVYDNLPSALADEALRRSKEV